MSDLDNEELIATRRLNGLNDNLYKENNIEEDISILEERIFNYELSIKIGSKDKMISTSIKENEAIKHLLEERKQDKKRIKELEDDLYIANYLVENSISKQKVKDKIKEIKRLRDRTITSEGFNILNGEVVVLQELLEENK